MPQRMTLNALLVLKELMGCLPEGETFGLEIARATGLEPSRVYPILATLEREGWVERREEQVNPAEVGRPARLYYRLTSSGASAASSALVKGKAKYGRLLELGGAL